MDNSDLIIRIIRAFNSLPSAIKDRKRFRELLSHLDEIKRIVVDKRPPRLAVVGRRGAGKSALFNALVDRKILLEGEVDTTSTCSWQSYKLQDEVEISWIDTPGLGAGQLKTERVQLLQLEFGRRPPDVLIFVHKASEVDSDIDATLDDLQQIVECTGEESARAELIVVLNQVDGIRSPLDLVPPYTKEKQDRIALIQKKLEWHLERRGIKYKCVVPAVAYFDDEHDLRFNIEGVATEIGRSIPSEAMLGASAALKFNGFKREIASKIVSLCAVAASCIALIPIPLSDIIPLTALQALMISLIGVLGGKTLSDIEIREFIVALGLLVATATAARQIVRTVLPLLGTGVSVAVAGATTRGIGAAAIAHYIDGESLHEARKKLRSLIK
ncbi:GTPase Era [Pandoraea horticolens]|uniref:GTPase Era n=1 Tax=Pandoraea horticolens TaxID=2508298 RepID=A0A5E4YUX0_9BURK|nr:GTPase [Pandoraea horticolens]VVE52247.1 GTPase Era [Pandoraea horticolens]